MDQHEGNDVEHNGQTDQSQQHDSPISASDRYTTQHSRNGSTAQSDEKPRPHTWWRSAAFWQAAFSGLLVITTVIHAYYYRQQWKVMTEQLETAKISAQAAKEAAEAAMQGVAISQGSSAAAEEQFRLDQRAWVSMETVSFTDPLKVGEPIKIVIETRNTGRTPALEVTTEHNLSFKEPTESEIRKPIPPIGSVDRIGPVAMAPGSVRGQFSHSVGTLMQADMERIVGGTATFRVYGHIKYWDIFRRKRRNTYFCMFYAPKGYPPGFRFCSMGNSMD